MKQGVFTVESNLPIADKTWRMRLSGGDHGFSRGGQFADFAIEGRFLRRPVAVMEWDGLGFEVCYKVVGGGTEQMSRLEPGDTMNVLTGLGNGFSAGKCRDAALLVAGGLGASPLLSLAKELIAEGKRVCVVMGYNKSSEIILADEYRSLGAEVIISTMDGSAGVRGLVTDALSEAAPEYDFFYTCGPAVMMKAVCDWCVTDGEASLEERMGCGCGICYGCTCHTSKGAARICADGPVFGKEDIIW